MTDVLTLAASEPQSLLAWLVLVFAAGMYPLGLLMPRGPLCNCCCPPGELMPDTLTVTLSNFPNDKVPTIWLCNLWFSADFYTATGGKAHATTPDACGTPDTFPPECWGPIGGIVVDEGGSNYAKLGHRHQEYVLLQPTASAFDGVVAKAEPTWTKFKNAEFFNLPAWHVEPPFEIVEPGTKYEYGTEVTLLADEGVASPAASGYTKVPQSPPTLTISGGTGTGLEATVNVRERAWTKQSPAPYEGMRAWEFESATIENGGEGYRDGDGVLLTLGEGDVIVSGYDLVMRTVRVKPTVVAALADASGSGVELEAVLAVAPTPANIQPFYSPLWRVVSVNVLNGGSGYTNGTSDVIFTVTDGQLEYFSGAATGTATISGGAVTSVTVNLPTSFPFTNFYYKDTGVVYAIDFTPFSSQARGLFYKTTGLVTGVVMPGGGGGTYYVEDATIPALVADVDVRLTQYPPSEGQGAVFDVVVDSTPSSETFGQIIAVNVTDGGDEYLARWWNNAKCCGDFYNGKSYVVKRSHIIEPFGEQADSPYPYVFPFVYFSNNKCIYEHNFCGTHFTDPINQAHWSSIVVEYPGVDNKPIVRVTRDQGCAVEMNSTTKVRCADMTFTAVADYENPDSQKAEVAPGGSFNPFNGFPTTQNNSCHPCCQATTVPVERYMITIIDTETGLPILLGYRNLNPNVFLSEAVEHLVIGQDGAGSWGGSLSFPSSGSATVVGWTPQYYGVRINPCANQSSTGGWVPRDAGSGSYPDGEDYCDNCWKQCEQQFYMPGYSGGGWLYTKQCDGCTASPRCNLTTGEYPLFSDYDTGPNGFFVPGIGGGWLPGPNQIGEFPPFATKYKLVLEAAA